MSTASSVSLRPATVEDVAALRALIARSARVLGLPFYSASQIEGALSAILGVDTQLIRDGTYIVAHDGESIAGCGGWSFRRTLFGGDAIAGKDDDLLDPRSEPARIRAFFVDPAFARRGIATAIAQHSESAAAAHGFRTAELAATLPGVPLYRALGYSDGEAFEAPLPDGSQLRLLRMRKSL